MPNIFELARKKREAQGEADVRGSETAAPAAPPAAPKIDFFRPLPKDPEAEAAKKRALMEMLRNR
jgi:hypothetical protein